VLAPPACHPPRVRFPPVPTAALALLVAVLGAAAVGQRGDDASDAGPMAAMQATELDVRRDLPDDTEPRGERAERTQRVAEPAAPEPVPVEGARDPIEAGGPRYTWSLEVEDATGLSQASVLATAEEALYDPRSWASTHEMVRVEPSRAAIRVLVATPATVDALCAEAGLVTNGIFSCWNGRVAAINVLRWNEGAREVSDLELYRRYVVNHEVGHALGFQHVPCTGRGDVSPLMAQQTKGLDGCTANPWPYPAG